ncbi:hypothetical protein ECC02_002848 [Trypanosoma cruzi]|uniref:Uncharacterized protein n=1 Tax=Trypanosoma cruzi TaxID=5693 RepID=A0A7J6YBP4_TRYCR|nr:hypothetical protein ECC02_002848 [Trypanosoma cruzi]
MAPLFTGSTCGTFALGSFAEIGTVIFGLTIFSGTCTTFSKTVAKSCSAKNDGFCAETTVVSKRGFSSTIVAFGGLTMVATSLISSCFSVSAASIFIATNGIVLVSGDETFVFLSSVTKSKVGTTRLLIKDSEWEVFVCATVSLGLAGCTPGVFSSLVTKSKWGTFSVCGFTAIETSFFFGGWRGMSINGTRFAMLVEFLMIFGFGVR